MEHRHPDGEGIARLESKLTGLALVAVGCFSNNLIVVSAVVLVINEHRLTVLLYHLRKFWLGDLLELMALRPHVLHRLRTDVELSLGLRLLLAVVTAEDSRHVIN